jgi:hypothetical protein
MKKSHRHDELSDRKCKVCGKAIKQRLVETKEKPPELCYRHHNEKEALRGHTVNTQPRKKRIIKGLPVKNFS